MAYNITLTNGQNLVTVADGTTDTSTTSLTLIGKNFAGYGQFLNENFIQLLENFSAQTQPPNPLQGQLWWDSNHKIIQVYNGSLWKNVSSTTSSSASPINPGIGDLWWDTANGQLKLFNTTTWVVIGPSYTASQGQTGTVADVVSDGVQSHIVVKFYVNNVVVAILSKDAEFSIVSIPGFTVIKPGLTLSSVGGLKYYGDADNALKLGGQPAVSYLRNDIPGVLQGNLAITSNQGLSVGASKDFGITADALAVSLTSTVSNKDVSLSVNVGGTQKEVLRLNAATGINQGEITVADPIAPTGIANKQYVDYQAANTDISTTTTATTTSNSTTTLTLATVPIATYRAAEFLIQAVNTVNAVPKYHVCKLHAIHNGTSASWVEYGSIDIGGQAAQYSVNIVSGNMQLRATPLSADNTTYKVTVTSVKL